MVTNTRRRLLEILHPLPRQKCKHPGIPFGSLCWWELKGVHPFAKLNHLLDCTRGSQFSLLILYSPQLLPPLHAWVTRTGPLRASDAAHPLGIYLPLLWSQAPLWLSTPPHSRWSLFSCQLKCEPKEILYLLSRTT